MPSGALMASMRRMSGESDLDFGVGGDGGAAWVVGVWGMMLRRGSPSATPVERRNVLRWRGCFGMVVSNRVVFILVYRFRVV